METTYHRGDVFFARLGDGVGSEQGGDRPVVIIQNNVGNQHSPTVIIAPFTTKGDRKPHLPTHCRFDGINGIEDSSTVLLEQIRTIDKQRLQRKLGSLSSRQMESLEQGVLISLGFIKPKADVLEMCLCKACLDNFYRTGSYRITRKNHTQKSLGACTYCNYRKGLDYVLIPKQKKHPKKKLIDAGIDLPGRDMEETR